MITVIVKQIPHTKKFQSLRDRLEYKMFVSDWNKSNSRNQYGTMKIVRDSDITVIIIECPTEEQAALFKLTHP